MTELEKARQELENYGFPDDLLTQLQDLVDKDDYSSHVEARRSLVKQGADILPIMNELVQSDIKLIRKEALKVIERVASVSSIDIAIDELDDKESEIRWIAAETLIRIGKNSIKPLLKSLIDNASSYYFREGAHHVLKNLAGKKPTEDMKQLIHYLQHDIEVPDVVPVYASKVLHEQQDEKVQ